MERNGHQPHAPLLTLDRPMHPPRWALLERQLLDAQAEACREFYDRYFDERGYLLCVPRWGGDDGPDDAAENQLNWTVLHALGADDDILELFHHGFEGHLRQYTEPKQSRCRSPGTACTTRSSPSASTGSTMARDSAPSSTTD